VKLFLRSNSETKGGDFFYKNPEGKRSETKRGPWRLKGHSLPDRWPSCTKFVENNFMHCYSCGRLLCEENISIEHVIPMAIGGRLKTKELLCRSCNSMFGDSIDADLCKQLAVIAGTLNIKRESGNNPIIKNVRSESGELYHLQNGRNPIAVVPEIEIDEKENIIHIGANDEKQIKSIIAGLKRKYPTLDDKSLESKMIARKYFLDEALHMKLEIGGTKFMKAIIKIAVNFYIHKKYESKFISERIGDLKSVEDDSVDIARHYYSAETLQYFDVDEVSHSVVVIGNPISKRLFAFVELFSSCAFVVNLNDNYDGPAIKSSYTYDVLKLTELKKAISLNYDGSILTGDLKQLNKEFISNLQTKLNRVFEIADQKQVKEIISEITKEASKKTLRTYPQGTVLTKEIMDEFVTELRKEAGPFIAHLNRQKRKNTK